MSMGLTAHPWPGLAAARTCGWFAFIIAGLMPKIGDEMKACHLASSCCRSCDRARFDVGVLRWRKPKLWNA